MTHDPAKRAAIDRLVDAGTMRFIKLSDVPKGHKVVYLRIVVDSREHNAVTERVRITVGGNKVECPG